MNTRNKIYKIIGLWFLILFPQIATSQISWPEGQLLPSFPQSASTQDLIYLNGSTPVYTKTWTWQAESDVFSHNTGKLDNDGWICQIGSDTPNQFMLLGPNDKNVTSGPNVAEFRMMIDNNTLDNDTIASLDVRNSTTGEILKSQSVTRKMFTSAGNYVSFKMDFQMPVDSQKIELRVFWKGTATVKVDYVSVKQNNADAEMYLFSSLKGLVNRKQPRIFSYEGDNFAEGPYTWLNSLGVQYIENKSSNLNILSKYLSEISGLIIYDPEEIHTVNLATTLAKNKNALVTAPSFISLLTSAPYNLPILEDLRGKFTSKLQVYQKLFDEYWPTIDHRLLIGLSPNYHKAALREYASALGAAVVWLDPKVTEESNLLNSFLATMPAGSNYMGWWPEEEPGVSRVSTYGITTIASDYCTNLTFHSGMKANIKQKAMPGKPILENKIYVAFILSDGDNLQYIEHLMRKLWNNPDRGSVPMGWTLSPAMVDAMPGALNYFHESATVDDNLISGPSGYGYTYPNYWTSQEALNQFVAKTEEYNVRAGFRVITVWNTITGGINRSVGSTYAKYAPTLLGMTAQNTGMPLSIYNSSLPGMPLTCNYCTGEQAMKDHIASASAGWTGTSPKFIIIQAQPWTGVTPTSFKNVMNSLGSNYKVVRPDHIFQLMREANNLTTNPGGIEGTGTGLTGIYYNGSNFENEVTTRVDETVNFDWGAGSPNDSIGINDFSVKWTGQIQPRYSDTYTFYLTSNNGSRLWIDNQLVIDNWNFLVTELSGTISLSAGQKYNLKLEYFEGTGAANCKMEWASSLQSREIIPKSQLYDSSQTGIENINRQSDIIIYPNPSDKGILFIDNANQNLGEANVTIYNIYGQPLLKEKMDSTIHQMDVSFLPKGMYLLKVKTDNHSESIRYIVK